MHHEAAAVLQVCLLVALDAWSYPPSEVYHVASEVVDSTRWTTAAGGKERLRSAQVLRTETGAVSL